MNSINATRPLADNARLMGEIAGATASQTGADAGTQGADDFAAVFKAMLGDVNQSQQRATRMAEAFDQGQEQDLAGVMIAQQKARLNFQATLQARNKLVSAYQDIMNMPI
ncbi:MAG TPA: flagellar hook-basal body complex protein FliE [Candidatus Competibacter sp.]|nr:flagellar hook-basal body complex protein FliE [Candidatus Competibacteraceae bacterium]HRE54489.1 flagellar hook-basal body complex protein FliE [Candidatus Competibacter sp.]HUM93058.1 flagellar hook-basal body complex protein FliE [Candidatus Competibacter sp.]